MNSGLELLFIQNFLVLSGFRVVAYGILEII